MVRYFTAAILGITAGVLIDVYSIPPLSLPLVFLVLGSILAALGLLTLLWDEYIRVSGVAMLVVSVFVILGGFTVEAILGVTGGLFAIAWDRNRKGLRLPFGKGSLFDYWLRGLPLFLVLVGLWTLTGTLLTCMPPLGFGNVACQLSDPTVVGVFLIGAGGFVSLAVALSIKWAQRLGRRAPPYRPESER